MQTAVGWLVTQLVHLQFHIRLEILKSQLRITTSCLFCRTLLHHQTIVNWRWQVFPKHLKYLKVYNFLQSNKIHCLLVRSLVNPGWKFKKFYWHLPFPYFSKEQHALPAIAIETEVSLRRNKQTSKYIHNLKLLW